MRRILAIAGLNLTQLFRDRAELVAVIGLPLLLTWVFGSAFGAGAAARTVVPVADLDHSAYSRAVVSAVEEPSSSVTVVQVTPAEAERRVKAAEAPVAIVIPHGFGAAVEQNASATIETVRDPSSSEAQAIVELVNGAADRIAADAKAVRVTAAVLTNGNGGAYPTDAPDFRDLYAEADRFWDPAPVGIESYVVQASATHAQEMKQTSSTQYSLGFTVFFVLMVALSGAGGIIEERELGTLRRLLATPLTRAQVILGKVFGVAGVASFEAAILVGFGALIFHVPWGEAPLAVVMVLGALVICSTGLGIMLSALTRTRSQLTAITPALSTAMAMIGGCYWPLDITPPFMQKLAMLTPTGWAMLGLKNTVARGMGVEAVLVPCAALLGMAGVFFVVGLSRLKLE